tara:strand:+ start:496 stop:609 length:114 start_codon:yes stop_codon:yes gene_type:complete
MIQEFSSNSRVDEGIRTLDMNLGKVVEKNPILQNPRF